MRTRLVVTGPADRATMWQAYAHTSRWPQWAPHLVSVDPEAELTTGLTGVVRGRLGVRASFRVTAVDPVAGTWSWTVRSGPVRLRLEHGVGDGWTSLTVTGPALVLAAYVPLARLALSRLVRARPAHCDRHTGAKPRRPHP
jgi:hypothetical protein